MTPAAGMAPNPSKSRQAMLWLMPEERSNRPTSGPTISPSACMENTMPTSRPRSFRFEYSLISTAETG